MRLADADHSKFNTLGNLASPPAPKQPRNMSDYRRRAEGRRDGGRPQSRRFMPPAADGPRRRQFTRQLAPDLSEIGNAGREDEWLFNYIYDGRVYNPDTVMTPWGSHGLFDDQEMRHGCFPEDTQISPAVFKTELDAPPPVRARPGI